METKSVIELKDSKSYDKILKSLEKKNYIPQYLPLKMEKLSNIKKVRYKEKLLKVPYLIDISHSLILKYYFKGNNLFNLSSLILKEKYGQLYNYYMDYLIDNKILNLEGDYCKGKFTKKYSINNDILINDLKRYKNKDSILIKKNKAKLLQLKEQFSKENDLIDQDVKNKLIEDLFYIDIQFEKSIYYLDNLEDKTHDVYNKNKYSVEAIDDKHIFYHFDDFGRMHTNYTILKSFIRKNCLLIEGEETFEVDIQNSQPLFLTKIISSWNNTNIDQNEYSLFRQLTLNGKFYDYVMDRLNIKDRNIIKKMTYKVFFGKNNKHSKEDIMFSSLFPSIHEFIKVYKKFHNNYKQLAYDLQKLESNLIFNKVIKKVMDLYPNARIITVHDSIMSSRSYEKRIKNIFYTELKKEFDF